MLSLTERPDNAIVGVAVLPLHRECDPGFDAPAQHYHTGIDGTNSDGGESAFHYLGGFCKTKQSIVEFVNGTWTGVHEDILYSLNDRCNDCLGTFDSPGYEGSWPAPPSHVGWQVNTYRNHSGRPNEVVSLTHRPKRAFIGRWQDGYAPQDCNTTAFNGSGSIVFCEVRYTMREYDEVSGQWLVTDNSANAWRVYTQGYQSDANLGPIDFLDAGAP